MGIHQQKESVGLCLLWFCNIKPQDIVDLELILKERRLPWYGHVERSNGAVKTAFDIQDDGKALAWEA